LVEKAVLEAIWRAGVAACLPERVVPPHLPEPPKGRTIILALGKAAVPMAQAVERGWQGELEGLAVAPRGEAGRLRRIEIMTSGHPTPDDAGVAAAERLLRLAQSAGPGDLVLVLLSGGASSLACLPGDGLALEEKRRMTESLLRSGADIQQINCVRRHLSRIKGGRLALAAAPARLVTLAISDVMGGRPEDIGSGPTAADPSTLDEARAVLASLGIDAPRTGWSATPKAVPGEYRIIARGADALAAAGAEAERLGYRSRLFECGGEARRAGAEHARLARSLAPGEALISGGELTVTVTGRGRGGPNQEYALAAAIALRGTHGLSGLAGDTDGIDGNGDSTGAFFDGATAGDGAEAALKANDSGTFLDSAGALFRTGPTGTNVNDLRIILCGPPAGQRGSE
jgi:hydroxypyruvate reductase